MPRKHLQGDPEVRPDECLISGSTFFLKIVVPAYFLGFSFCWLLGVGYSAIGKRETSAFLGGGYGLLIMAGCLRTFIRSHFPLKKVWVGDSGLRVSNFWTQIELPFAAIESITQLTESRLRHVIIELNQETSFGRRITFVPNISRTFWPFGFGEAEIVIDLRERVKAARRCNLGKKAAQPLAHSGRSVMADDELDGPF